MGRLPSLDTRVDRGDSKLRDLIDSAFSRSRDQPEGQYDPWCCAFKIGSGLRSAK